MNLLYRLLRWRTLWSALRSPLRYRSFWILSVIGWLLNRQQRRRYR